jgi:hypothetical protein
MSPRTVQSARHETNFAGCVANFEQGHEDGRRSVTGSGSKQIELLCQ